MSCVCEKCGSEPVERVPTTSNPESEIRTISAKTNKLVHSYVTFKHNELPPLQYFKIKINGYSLEDLVDSGSNWTLLGREGIEIIRMLNLATAMERNTRIRTANGQIVTIREKIDIPFELENQYREVTIALLPNLAVPCILRINFLTKFDISLDFTSGKWFFHWNAIIVIALVLAKQIPSRTSCSGLSELTPNQKTKF